MNYLGDFATGQTTTFAFSTQKSNGQKVTLLGTPVVSVYKDGSTDETTTGVTLVVDFDAVTGLNHVTIVMTDAFYTSGSNFRAVITAGTVDGISVVGTVLCCWSIEARSANRVAPDNTAIGEIKAQTDKMQFTGTDINAVLSEGIEAEAEMQAVDGTISMDATVSGS